MDSNIVLVVLLKAKLKECMPRQKLSTRLQSSEGFHRLNINNLKGWRSLNIEPGGARVKTIVTPPNKETKFLYKLPKYGEFETVTEIFNSILALELGINHTQYYPGHFPPFDKGVFCKSFLNESAIEELWEMKELLCRYSNKPSLEKQMGRDTDVLKEHSIDNIYMILDDEFASPAILTKFFEMIGFDALIGHGDRHWSNYGVIVSGHPVRARFSPLYDTASGYLVELDESRCLDVLEKELNDPAWYRPKVKGLCKITVPGNIKSNHFDLLEYILVDSNMSRYKHALAHAFKQYRPAKTKLILNRFFPNLSPIRSRVIEKILLKRWEIGGAIFAKYNIKGFAK